ncbi:MAG: TolC family protein [Fuerstiella sp.]
MKTISQRNILAPTPERNVRSAREVIAVQETTAPAEESTPRQNTTSTTLVAKPAPGFLADVTTPASADVTGQPDPVSAAPPQASLFGTTGTQFAPPVPEPVNPTSVPSAPSLRNPSGGETVETPKLTAPIDPNQGRAIRTTPSNAPGQIVEPDRSGIHGGGQPPGVPQQFDLPSSAPHRSFQDVGVPPMDPVSEQPATFWGHSYFGPSPGMSGYRATIENDADVWMSPYADRANQAAGSPALSAIIPAIAKLPPGFSPWWDATVRQSTGLAKTSMDVDVSGLLQDAMLYSPQVIAIQTEPEVQYRVVTQEAAKFDWTAFLETTYDNLNDPIGNTLTTANGATRLLTRKIVGSGGVRQRNLHGGEFRIASTIGDENQNSSFFVPNNQGTARLELSYRQPLLDGAGRAYNESEIVLARIQANGSEDEVVDALQAHLIKVTEAYWTLYRARAEFLQRQKLFASAHEVLRTLEGRNQVDTIPRQILRAKAAVARSQTGIQRTVARVRDAEAQLRLSVNSPGMLNGGPTELTPVEAPGMVTETADLRDVLQTALVNRPDISEAIRKMRASGVRLGVSRRELLPRLDFLVESYVADLTGGSNVGRSYRDMYTDNRPGFTVGLEFEIPLGNRAAQAKYEQRQWELKRSVNVFRATVEKSLTDVEIANREVATAFSEMQSRFQAMSAAENETAYLRDRFEVLPMVEDSATLLLEDLLDSFERLADEESGFVQALVDHAVAIVKLKKEIGILLRTRNSGPTVESDEQRWMADRLDSAVGGRSADSNLGSSHESAGQLPVEANVPRAVPPNSLPKTVTSSRRILSTQSNGSEPPSRITPRRVGGHTF